ncbi:MAG: DUF2318 domain-containing protein [bacterium]|nr:DUF2318 domain-containing protein [bacterium]MDT8365854.1 DUF2318 domain-containing protein [bacterium]
MAKKTKKKNTDNPTSREFKKAAVLGTGKKSKAPLIITLFAAAILAGGALYFLGPEKEAGPVAATAAAVKNDATEFVYNVSDYSDGKARYYSYKTPQGLAIRYFLLKSSDGVIRAAFDACDTCWAAGKGYRQEGDFMVCNNCGLRFSSVKINEIKGGCNPAPLTRETRGDKIIVKVKDIIDQGSFYFDFNRS